MTENHTKGKHRSVQWASQPWDRPSSHAQLNRSPVRKNQIFLHAYLLIILYWWIPNDSYGDEVTGPQ